MQDIPGPSDSPRDLSFYEAVLHKKDGDTSGQKSEAGSRVSVLRQNGNLSRPSSLSKRGSINLSRQSLDSSKDSLVCQGESSPVSRLLFSVGYLSIVALVFCVLSVLLLISLSHIQYDHTLDTLIFNSTVFEEVLEVCVAMTTLVAVLNLCCLMVCAMQVFFAVKILILPQGEQRARQYLRDCASSRSVAVMGFFVSIPAFFVSLVLFMFLQYRSTSAIVSVAILSAGFVLCLMSALQNTYQWQAEKEQAGDGLPSYEPPTSSLQYKPQPLEMTQAKSELSTLV